MDKKNNTSNIYVFGDNGMLGNIVYVYLKNKNYNVFGINRKHLKIEMDNEYTLSKKLDFIGIKEGSVIINCIGLIKQRQNISDDDFILLNTIYPLILSNVCSKLNIKLIHITTDCVFSGHIGKYDENFLHDPIDIYGKTKSLGESNNCTTVRTSIIGEEKNNKLSLIEWVKSNKDKTIYGYTNHFWNGVTCLQLSKIFEDIIVGDLYWKGVRHIFSETISKHDLIKVISDIYNLNINIIPKETHNYCDRTLSTIYDNFVVPDLKTQIYEQMNFFKHIR